MISAGGGVFCVFFLGVADFLDPGVLEPLEAERPDFFDVGVSDFLDEADVGLESSWFSFSVPGIFVKCNNQIYLQSKMTIIIFELDKYNGMCSGKKIF